MDSLFRLRGPGETSRHEDGAEDHRVAIMLKRLEGQELDRDLHLLLRIHYGFHGGGRTSFSFVLPLSPDLKGGGSKERKRKEVASLWGAEKERGLEELERASSSGPALKPLVYTPEADYMVGRIVLGVKACRLGFGVIL